MYISRLTGIPSYQSQSQNSKKNQTATNSQSNAHPKDRIDFTSRFSGTSVQNKLMRIVKDNDANAFREFCHNGGNPDEPIDVDGNTAILLSAKKGSNKVLNEALSCGADFKKQNRQGDTALHLAALTDHGNTLLPLLKHIKKQNDPGSLLNQANQDGNTAIMVAGKMGAKALINLLQTYGADLNHRNKQDQNLYWVAKEAGQRALAMQFESIAGHEPNPIVSSVESPQQVSSGTPSISPTRFVMQQYIKELPLYKIDKDLSPYLDAKVSDYLAERVKDDLEANDDNKTLLTKVRLATQYKEETPDKVRAFWDQVTHQAVGKTVLEILRPRAKGLAAVAGMQDVKDEIETSFLLPHKFKLDPESFRKANGELPYANANVEYGLLLHGLPGTGKSYIANKLVEELKRPVLHLKFASVGSSMYSDTEKAVVEAFKKAAEQAPSFIVVDEIDSFLIAKTDRTNNEHIRLINTFLTELEDAQKKGVTVIGTTNHMNKLEEASVREGRFDLDIKVPPPDKQARLALFNMYLPESTPDKQLPFTDEEREKFAEMTRGFSAPRIEKLCKRLGNLALKKGDDIHPEIMHKLIQEKGPSYKEAMNQYPNID
jgi:AAA+ superfamily predicted ATPase